MENQINRDAVGPQYQALNLVKENDLIPKGENFKVNNANL